MDVQRVVEGLHEVERRMDVTRLVWRDILVWPLLRDAINAHVNAAQNLVASEPAERRDGPAAKAPLWTRAWRRWRRSQEMRHSARRLTAAASDRLLVVTDSVYHTDLLNNEWYDRFADPLMEILPRGQAIKVDLSNRVAGACHVPSVTADLRECHNIVSGRLRRLSGRDGDPATAIAGYGELLGHLRDVFGIDALDPKTLMATLIRFEVLARHFETIFRQGRPKAVFVVCYYALERRAITHACRRLGVRVVDIQHGKQGRFHHAYTHWSRIPSRGWDALPDVFWVWGEESADNIVRYMPKACAHHRPVVIGNLWLAFWKADHAFELSAAHTRYLGGLAKFDRRILVSLQPISQPLEPALLAAMAAAPAEWRWLIRLHPNMRSERAKIAEGLERVAPGRFEMDMATEVPLYALLKSATHHVTGWSSVAYEALALGVPTALVHATALQLYEQYIADGHFAFAHDGKELAEFVQFADGVSKPEARPYIRADLGEAKSALARLLSALPGPERDDIVGRSVATDRAALLQ